MAQRVDGTSEKARPPIVAVMGHVDHGKTSILDAIRHTNVSAGEYGGITQHIGAYQIEHKNHPITFIDTPGHEAFTQMRARGGKTADIVVLVVAADDGVMPQTKEAIGHAKAFSVPIIVVINKVDLPSADIRKVKQQLAQEDLLVEDWGGQVISVEVSAKTGVGLDKLLDAILATAELLQLHGDPSGELEAGIVEARLDKKKGVVVSAIVRNGSLSVGDEISASGQSIKVRSLRDDKGLEVKKAVPGLPVEILGFRKIPNVGDIIVEAGSELSELSVDESRVEVIGQNTKKTVNVILRADTQGTLEAVKASLAKLVSSAISTTYSLKFLLCAPGGVVDSDVTLAGSTSGIIIGFNVSIAPSAADLAQNKHISIKVFRTIYELIDEVSDMLAGVASVEEQKIKGRAQVLKIFKLPSKDVIAGCKVLAGRLKASDRVAIYDKDPADLKKEDLPVYTGSIRKLKKEKEEIGVAGKDTECGVLLRPQFEAIAADLFIEVL